MQQEAQKINNTDYIVVKEDDKVFIAQKSISGLHVIEFKLNQLPSLIAELKKAVENV